MQAKFTFPGVARLSFPGWLWAVALVVSGLLAGPARAQRFSAGVGHKMAIHADGTLWAWGYNYYGQLGLGSFYTPVAVPTQVGTDANWRSVGAGNYNTLAIKTDGTLWSWGNAGYNILGDNSTVVRAYPAQVGTATNWQSLSVGPLVVMAIKTDGTLWAWGTGAGQLGLGGTSSQATPVQVGTATTWKSVSIGTTHVVAVRTDGTLWAWGNNSYGQLGTGGAAGTVQNTPVQVGTATTWSSASAGAYHTLAVRTDGTLWAWGFNGSGQLGIGVDDPASTRTVPTQVGPAATWLRVAAGDNHSLAVRQDGTLWGWGYNRYGQAGSPSLTRLSSPVQVGTGTTWQDIAAGVTHSMGTQQNGTLWSWGHNRYGELGTGDGPALTPGPVGSAAWASVVEGQAFALGVQANGTLWSWGSNDGSQLGLGAPATAGLNRVVPTQVGTAATWQAVAAGSSHGLALRQDGTIWTWGYNAFGQLGDGTTTTRTTPVQIGTATNWLSVAGSYDHSLAVRQDGTLWSWGEGSAGQLGTGTIPYRRTPGQVGTATTWRSVSAGYTTSLGVQTSGALFSWGYNDEGQLGYGSPINPLPTFIPNGGAPLATTYPTATAAWALAPNPAHDAVQVLGLPAGPVAVRLYDATGRLLRQASAATLPTAGLAPGLYLLRATSGEATRTLRLQVE